MSFDKRVAYIVAMAYGLEDEIHEATNEVDWKPWANGEVFNRDAYLGELVDAFHFLMNMILAVGGQPEKLASEFCDRYHAKRAINAARADNGYDGRSTKCGSCGRAIEDGTLIDQNRMQSAMIYRCVCGSENCLSMEVT